MRVCIKKSIANGKIVAPPSKSMAHRMLILAGLSNGKSIIHGVSLCEDVLATIDCLKALGIDCEITRDTIIVNGKNIFSLCPNEVLNCRESGSTLRFFIPIAMLFSKTMMLKGAKKLLERPLTVYQDLAKENNLLFVNDGESVVVKGKLNAGNFSLLGNVSSQFISGLLFVLPLLNGDSEIKIVSNVESKSYINMTIYALSIFGVNVTWKDDNTLFIKGNQKYIPQETTVEGDYSNAVFFDAFNYLDGNVEVLGLNEDSTQGDKIYKKYLGLFNGGIPSIHLGDCPDLAPILFSLSAIKHGGIFLETHRLKLKESDRGEAMAEELKKFGVNVNIHQDSITIYPTNFHKPTEILRGHNDHRIVMALAILLTKTGGAIDGAEAVNKSNPDFFNSLKQLGIEVTYEDND